MARDNARAVPQPVLERAPDDIALPSPRPPVLEATAHDIPRPARELAGARDGRARTTARARVPRRLDCVGRRRRCGGLGGRLGRRGVLGVAGDDAPVPAPDPPAAGSGPFLPHSELAGSQHRAPQS